jgi:hypothetical protein
VSSGELVLGIKPNAGLNPSKSITYNLTVEDLDDITLAGSGNIYTELLQTNNMRILLSGSGDIQVKGLNGAGLSINLSGSGNITIKQTALVSVDTSINGSGVIGLDGKADKQTIVVNGSGKYIAGDLETTSANISISGQGDVTLWAKETLDLDVNGIGNVSYYGRPVVNQRGNGLRNMSSLGEK